MCVNLVGVGVGTKQRFLFFVVNTAAHQARVCHFTPLPLHATQWGIPSTIAAPPGIVANGWFGK